jgi:hypothetical protein
MIRDFLNVEDDGLDCAAETAVRIPAPDFCDLRAVDDLPLGMTYAPMQKYRKLYSPEEALHRGTLFCELDLPFLGGNKA